MSSENYPGIGSSRYRQLRLTITHETNGRFSYALYAKQLNKEWTEKSCLVRRAVDGLTTPLNSTEDVLQAVIHLLEEEMLPGVTDPRK